MSEDIKQSEMDSKTESGDSKKLQLERDVLEKQSSELKAQKTESDRKLQESLRESENAKSELEKVRKQLSETNSDDASKRFKIKELSELIKTKEEQEAQLKTELETLKSKTGDHEKAVKAKETELETIKSKLAEYETKDENEKKTQIERAKKLSEKLNDPDILELITNAKDNKHREKLFKKLEPVQIDTIKTTSFFVDQSKQGNGQLEKVLDIAGIDPVKLMKLREDDPSSFNDIAEMLKKVHY